MRQLADDVWQLDGFPSNNINVYVIGDVLIDAGIALHKRRILRQVEGRAIAAHALTHAHFDHYGASHAVCEALSIPLWCGAADVEAVEAGKMIGPGGRRVPGPRAHPVARALREGDEVAGFAVLDVPGHSPGHVAYWRESDRVLVLGDVLNNMDVFTGIPGLRQPKKMLTPDPSLNLTSIKKLGVLEPSLVCFGHGAPLRDTAKFTAFCEAA